MRVDELLGFALRWVSLNRIDFVKTPFQQFCAVIGADPDDENVHLWYAAANAMGGRHDLMLLCRGFAWHQRIDELVDKRPHEWPKIVNEAGLTHPALRDVLPHLVSANPKMTAEQFLGEVLWRVMEIERLDIESLDHLASSMMQSTESMIAALDCLRTRNEVSEAVLETFPELMGLRTARTSSVEHEAILSEKPMPLLEHLVDRTLARKLLGLERNDIRRFQLDDALSAPAFGAEVAVIDNVRAHDMLPLIRCALLFLDFSKGGSLAQRERWIEGGADLTVHNEASAAIVQENDGLRRFPRIRANPLYTEIVVQLIRFHGTVGQSIRGESPLSVFAGYVDFLRAMREPLAAQLIITPSEAVDLLVDMLHIVNVVDTAAVREGLFTDELRFELVALENLLRRMGKGSGTQSTVAELDQFDVSKIETEDEQELLEMHRQWLWDRLCRLRRDRISRGEPTETVVAAVRGIDAEALGHFCNTFCRAQLWYCEVATSELTPLAQMKLLGLAMNAARDSRDIDHTHPFDVSFEFMVEAFEQRTQSPTNRYRLRLLETVLNRFDIDEVFRGEVGVDALNHLLGTLEVSIGGRTALAMNFATSEEAEALITLLVKYEQRSTAAFHSTLKTLCDLYGLRKDEFDRLANESSYLATMNAARSDKERMLDYACEGLILEIGPGGGVVLDLLESRFPSSRVVGVDVSAMVVEALNQRKELERKKWEVVEADAFDLPKHFETDSVDTIVLCSVLHEIYSYVEFAVSEKRKFRLESVRDLLRSCYNVLKPGGRILIRDGIMPEDEPRIIEFIDPDGPDFFRLFAEQFEGRQILGEWLNDTVVRLSAPDAMEFLYCYTWGPASFPYEVREQYGVLPYEEYCDSIRAWLCSPQAKIVDLPGDIRSYLQEGYKTALADKVIYKDVAGDTVDLPDSNCLIVVEKP